MAENDRNRSSSNQGGDKRGFASMDDDKQREIFGLLIEACAALRRENHEILYASMIKDTMKRKMPSFDESYFGYRSFTHVLEDADNLGLVDIERNPKSGTYMVTRISGEGAKDPARKPQAGEKSGGHHGRGGRR